ncbi:hypothetical protein GIB67_020987 [Kingdonia uniflora]|uniref:Exonuclease domain-containing protein n=1 Tax=Kingdonia uniflora TaxID=39325 RepID=A0A7J7NCN2_9MAGN|nr:hypothetical protein GIB67_020987 [Kingdonia uniflora]
MIYIQGMFLPFTVSREYERSVKAPGQHSLGCHILFIKGNVVYDEYVRPMERVVDFRTEISGIRPRDLRKAKDFRVAQKEVADMIKGRLLVGHALRNDLRALLLSHPKYDVRDTAEYRLFLKGGRRRSLRGLASEFLGVKIQHGEHCL